MSLEELSSISTELAQFEKLRRVKWKLLSGEFQKKFPSLLKIDTTCNTLTVYLSERVAFQRIKYGEYLIMREADKFPQLKIPYMIKFETPRTLI